MRPTLAPRPPNRDRTSITKIYLPLLMRRTGPSSPPRSGNRAEAIGSPMPDPGADTDSPAAADQRQPRQSRLVKAELGCARLGRFDVTIRNVSHTGIGGQGPHMLHVGERMTIFLPGHDPMPGTVRWVHDRRFGIETD